MFGIPQIRNESKEEIKGFDYETTFQYLSGKRMGLPL